MISTSIADYLQTQGCGRTGKSIFQYEMPAECKDGVLILDNYYGTAINHYLPGYHATEFRVIVRGSDMLKAEALMKKVSAALTIKSESNAMSGLQVKQSLPQNLPRVYMRSAGGYWEMEVDVDMNFVVL